MRPVKVSFYSVPHISSFGGFTVPPGQMDHGKMNAPALRFITFIQTHQPVYLQASTSTHLEIALVIFFPIMWMTFSQSMQPIRLFFFFWLLFPPPIFGNSCVVTLYNPVLNLWISSVFIVRKEPVKWIWHPLKGMWRVHWLRETSHPFRWPMPTSKRWTSSRHCHLSNKEWLYCGSLPLCVHLSLPSCATTFTYNSEQLAPWLWFRGCVLRIDQECKIIGLQDWWKLWIISWRGK